MFEYNVNVNQQDMLNVCLAFEALVDHDCDYFCIRCDHHPKVLKESRSAFPHPVI